MSSLALATATLVLLVGSVLSLDYDSYCDTQGHIRDEHAAAVQALVQRAPLLEQLHVEAAQGHPRATQVFHELETQHFPEIGRAVADRTHALSCAIPVYRELSGSCLPNWAFLDFLSKEQPGGIRLRTALGAAYSSAPGNSGSKPG
ncbi:hypothetical protein [Archangium primigenium]|uniref:hypothetical protein n=1 Tax=[Archangium] primigenium TaxID=2792470 RepID=UPI00195C1C0C|nr:hypothetical protein [Archangium primigenium]MBM7112609.1 hypothetical protein [Archangium primigenium]